MVTKQRKLFKIDTGILMKIGVFMIKEFSVSCIKYTGFYCMMLVTY